VAASVLMGEQELERWLADGQVRCSGCGGSLSRWGHARERRVRMLHGVVRRVRPRRARCAPCERTHVLLPGWSVPRRRDGSEVIGLALLLKADGAGHRTIAHRLGRPPGTVRGWLRAAQRRTDELAQCGTLWTIALGEETPRPTIRLAASGGGGQPRQRRACVAAALLRAGPRLPLDGDRIPDRRRAVARAACSPAGLLTRGIVTGFV
jgi:Domain of unknown function (DUF6431)